jgi:putative membrane protein
VSTPPETQPERTALSWQRTGVGVVGVAGLMAHRAVVGGHPGLLVPAGLCALLGVALVSGVGVVRDRRVRERVARGEPVADARLAVAATVAVGLVALAAAVSVLVVRLT